MELKQNKDGSILELSLTKEEAAELNLIGTRHSHVSIGYEINLSSLIYYDSRGLPQERIEPTELW